MQSANQRPSCFKKSWFNQILRHPFATDVTKLFANGRLGVFTSGVRQGRNKDTFKVEDSTLLAIILGCLNVLEETLGIMGCGQLVRKGLGFLDCLEATL